MFLLPSSARHDPKEIEYPGKSLPKGWIRLVQLMPGDWKTPIQCKLFDELHGTTDYHALSYVWGSKNVTRPIVLDRRAFPVTVNLESALRHLRERYKDMPNGLTLWVDALCINQKDVDERTSQVQLMRKIYAQCKKVIVYLGDRLDGVARSDEPPPIVKLDEVNGGSDWLVERGSDYEAYDVLRALQELASGKHMDDIAAFGGWCSAEHNQVTKTKVNQVRFFEAMRRMMQPPFTPWWSRIWVVQEISVAPVISMVYGMVSASWRMFASASENYFQHGTTCCSKFIVDLPQDQRKVLENCCRSIEHIVNLRQSLRNADASADYQLWLHPLLYRFRNKKATDPRDKVYALLSMARTPLWQQPMVPDYALSEVEVFRQATLQCIYEDRTLSLFSTELGRKFRNDLPSWVPDWSAPGGLTYDIRAAIAALYNASPGFADEHTVRSSGNTLEANGLYFDTVTKVGEVMWAGGVPNICQATLLNWLLISTGRNLNDDSLPGPNQDFWRMICGDVVSESDGDRRAIQEDELTYVTWALASNMSPFQDKFVDWGDTAQYPPWSSEAKVWRDVLQLWPGKPVLAKRYVEEHRATGHLIPAAVRDNVNNEIWKWNVECLLTFLDDHETTLRWAQWREEDVQKLPWCDLLSRIRKRLASSYEGPVDLDSRSRSKHILALDNMIMAATESRRLIVGHGCIGLGPMDTEIGDELFFLEGGKTPFVLRPRGSQTQFRSEFEIVGDSYIQDMMDGQWFRERRTRWRGVMLV